MAPSRSPEVHDFRTMSMWRDAGADAGASTAPGAGSGFAEEGESGVSSREHPNPASATQRLTTADKPRPLWSILART